ncbi:MAG: excinuclease ABC subunit UvrC [Coriobacteriales bacterium]|jgi:excinuclease ABC subunit C
MDEFPDMNPLGGSGLTLRQQVAKVPQLPGVYLWKNGAGEVVYVGKAKQLRNRMMQYIAGTDERVMIPFMMEQVRSFEYIVTESEHEALVLEKNLINQYDPHHNVAFRDDKSYPYIAITKGDRFPAIKYTREKHVATTRYFGPYTDSRAARELVDVVRRIVPLCSAGCAQYKALKRRLERGDEYQVGLFSTGKACFDHHVGLGPGPCCGACTEEEYADAVAKVERFLSGQRREFAETLEEQMREAAADLDFEKAARIRNRISIVTELASKQHVELSRDLDCDVVGVTREETIAGVNVFVVREGTIINTCEFILDKGMDVPLPDLLETFLVRYYDRASEIPREVVIEEPVQEAEVLEQWLTEKLASKHGAKVHLRVPVRGEKNDLLQMARQNAGHSLQRFKVRTRYDEARVNDALLQLESALALPGPPMRIECYDISTIHGKHSVASMVVFTGGRVDSSQYRRFKIRMETPEANDVAMMRETLERRFSAKNRGDERFAKRPDLIVLDGGKPQLNAVRAQLAEMGLDDIPLAGLAKSDEELFVTWSDEPVYLPLGSSALYLVKHVRDEAHRFAITYHRQLRGKGMTASVLDSVTGLGPKRKKALLKEFGSVKRMRSATVDEIAAVPGIPREVAEEVVAVLEQVYSA